MLEQADLEAIANEILGAALADAGLERAEVESGYDHDNEPALFVTLRFRPHSGIVEGAASTSSLAALRRRLLSIGEERFPYFRYRYPNDEVLSGEEEPTAA